MASKQFDPKKLVEYDSFLRFLSTIAGREKLFRTLQYALLFVGSLSSDRNPTLAGYLKKMETSFSSTRRCLRIGNMFSTVKELLNLLNTSSTQSPSPFVYYTTLSKSISTVIYLIVDHLGWLMRTCVIQLTTEKQVFREMFTWGVMVVFQVMLDCYNLSLNTKRMTEAKMKLAVGKLKKEAYDEEMTKLKSQRSFLYISFLKNFFDSPLIMFGLNKNFFRFTPTFLGFCGTLSSLCGSLQAWPF